MLARVGNSGILEPQPQAPLGDVGAGDTEIDARPGQFGDVAADGEALGGIKIERMNFLAAEHRVWINGGVSNVG